MKKQILSIKVEICFSFQRIAIPGDAEEIKCLEREQRKPKDEEQKARERSRKGGKEGWKQGIIRKF